MTGAQELAYCYPVLDWQQYTVWDSCHFLDPEYLRIEKAQHTGSDFNGRRGGNTDLGDPVYSITDGVVTYAGNHRVIGNIVIVRFDDHSEGAYWHLQHWEPGLQVGSRVYMGQRIGRIGQGGLAANGRPRFLAHLHFEWRKRAGVCAPDEWPGITPSAAEAYRYIEATRYNPEDRLKEVNAFTTLRQVSDYYAARRGQATTLSPNAAQTDQSVSRVMVETSAGTWQDVAGQRAEVRGIIINASDPTTIWIRQATEPQKKMDTTSK